MLLTAVEDAAQTTVTWTTPTVVVAILAPAVALIGVLISNWWNGQDAIKAEDKRHANVLVAEGVRHQNALEAEDRRHANSLRQLTFSTVVTTTNDLYADIETARHRLAAAVYRLKLAMQNIRTWNANGEKAAPEFDVATEEFREVRARSALTASKEVAALCNDVWRKANGLNWTLVVSGPPLEGGDDEERLLDAGRERQALSLCLDALLQQMRQELHGVL